MTDGATPSGRNDARGRSKPPSRKLNFPARVRTQFRRGADRVLDAELAWSGAFVFIVVLLMANQHCGADLGKFSVGDVAPYDVKAPRDIDDVDEALTDEGRKRAQDEVPEVYVHDGQRGERRARELGALFGRVRGRSAPDAETGGVDARPGSVRDKSTPRRRSTSTGTTVWRRAASRRSPSNLRSRSDRRSAIFRLSPLRRVATRISRIRTPRVLKRGPS